ncbi:transposase family protein [Streptomyces sp. NPDC059893]|uniref:transposase family protein n=1 Tax=Streptomyces sp. NPDC059893 TaxID=3346990 RepID=UPI00364B2A08
MKDVNEIVQAVFSGLSPLVTMDATDEGERSLVRARTPKDPVPCAGCGVLSGRVYGYHRQTMADVPTDGRQVVVLVQVQHPAVC